MSENTRVNTPTEQNKEDNTLVLYRLKLVEDAVKSANDKLDRLDNIKRTDLLEFRDDLSKRISEAIGGIQKEVDDVKKDLAAFDEKKADQKELDDVRALIKGVAAVFATVVGGLVLYYLTVGKN